MEPNVEGMEGDHIASNDFPFGAKSLDGLGGAPDPPLLQHPVCNPDHDGP